MRVVWFAVLAACDAGLPEPVEPSPPGPHEITAVVRIAGETEECSNLGGRHYTLEIDESAHRIVHFGGHGQLPIDGSSWPAIEANPRERYYVAKVRFDPFTLADGGWCLPPTHYAGSALAMRPATDLADARAQLAIEYGRLWPGPSSNRM